MKSIAELLNLRYEFETRALNLNIPENRKVSCINNIEWFKENGHIKNRFKCGYKECLEICDILLKAYYKRE
jgi:hypothetical protein|tara:strand:+ start:1205 stop:1417 length:213 start_codon:yes stop_codon:yes gene_type:complete